MLVARLKACLQTLHSESLQAQQSNLCSEEEITSAPEPTLSAAKETASNDTSPAGLQTCSKDFCHLPIILVGRRSTFARALYSTGARTFSFDRYDRHAWINSDEYPGD